jgi:hypothetical protein
MTAAACSATSGWSPQSLTGSPSTRVIETGTESYRLRTSSHGSLTRPRCRTLCPAVTDRSRAPTPGGFTGTGVRVILIL